MLMYGEGSENMALAWRNWASASFLKCGASMGGEDRGARIA
jgi:hypothetical protein